jgi:hypothetical protein
MGYENNMYNQPYWNNGSSNNSNQNEKPHKKGPNKTKIIIAIVVIILIIVCFVLGGIAIHKIISPVGDNSNDSDIVIEEDEESSMDETEIESETAVDTDVSKSTTVVSRDEVSNNLIIANNTVYTPDKIDSSVLKELATVDEQVIYNDRDIKITVTGIEPNLHGYELSLDLKVENNSDKNIILDATNSIINNIVVDTFPTDTIKPGEVVDSQLRFITGRIYDSRMTNISDIKFVLTITNYDTRHVLDETAEIEIKTSINDSYTIKHGVTGEVVISTLDGINIVAEGLVSDTSYYNNGYVVFISNSSNSKITVDIDDVYINDIPVTSGYWVQIPSNCYSTGTIVFTDEVMEANNITDIEKVQFTVTIKYDGSYKAITTQTIVANTQ